MKQIDSSAIAIIPVHLPFPLPLIPTIKEKKYERNHYIEYRKQNTFFTVDCTIFFRFHGDLMRMFGAGSIKLLRDVVSTSTGSEASASH